MFKIPGSVLYPGNLFNFHLFEKNNPDEPSFPPPLYMGIIREKFPPRGGGEGEFDISKADPL